jgi:hypothetical protein
MEPGSNTCSMMRRWVTFLCDRRGRRRRECDSALTLPTNIFRRDVCVIRRRMEREAAGRGVLDGEVSLGADAAVSSRLLAMLQRELIDAWICGALYAPRMEPSRRRAPAAAVAVALGIALVALVVLASAGGTVRPAIESRTSASTPATTTPTELPSVGVATPPVPKPGHGPRPLQVPRWLIALLQAAALAIGALAIGALVLLSLFYPLRAVFRLVREIELPLPEPDDIDWERVKVDRVAAALDSGLAEGLAAVESGTSTDGVIACWVALEAAAASAGVPRAMSETSTEFTVRVLGAVGGGGISEPEWTRLAQLYREARFSTHGANEQARREARAALARIRSDLSSLAGTR